MAGPRLPKIQVDLVGAWTAVGSWGAVDHQMALDVFERGGRRAAEILKLEISDMYKHGISGHVPLHPFTVETKGHDQPLYESGELADGVEVFVVRHGNSGQIDFMVGFPQGELAKRAELHENGAVFALTEGRRRFFAAHGWFFKASTRYLFVPARPVFAAALGASRAQVEQIMRDEFEKAIAQVRHGRVKGPNTGFWAGVGGFFRRIFKRG